MTAAVESRHPIVARRDALGLSAKDLAAKAGIAIFTVERIETGLTRLPQERTLDAIATALDADRDTLEDEILSFNRARRSNA